MPTIDVKGHLIDFPDNLSPDELNKAVGSAAEQLPDIGNMGGDSLPEPEGKKGLIRRGWDALAVPEQMSREGLGKLADMVPEGEMTGNMAADIARGTPKVIAETFAEAAPSFISRGSLVTGGVLKGAKMVAPAVKVAGRGLAKWGEAASGLEHKTPGVLAEAFKDPKLMLGKGKEAAGKMFEGLLDEAKIRPEFLKPISNEEVVNQAMKFAEEGALSPQEAIIARRSLDAIKKTIHPLGFRRARDAFDSVAKTISKDADKAFSRAIKSEALRSPFALNKTGGASAFKLGTGMLTGTLKLQSPAFQGGVASLLGLAAKGVSPVVGLPLGQQTAIGALVDLLKRRRASSEGTQ
jgi:hypothetical protein